MAEPGDINSENLVPLEDLPCLDGNLTELDIRPQMEDHSALPPEEKADEQSQSTPMVLEPDTGELGEKMDEEQVGEPTESAPTTDDSGYVFKCAFCEMVLSSKDRPKILECLHNACGVCIDQKVQEMKATPDGPQEIHCTTCGYYFDPKNIIDNQFLTDTESSEDSKKLENIKCSSCSDQAIATSWCVDCVEFICDNCVQAHQRLKITKDHTIKAKEEGQLDQSTTSNGESPLYCQSHPQERLSLFCENCDKLTCRDCQLTEHRDHKYKFTHEIAADSRNVLNEMLTDISYKRLLLSSAMKVIDERQGLINEKKQALAQQITGLVMRLTNQINMRGKQLVSRLNEVCDSKQRTLDEKKIALDHLSQITDHCIVFTRNVLEYGSDMAILYSKKHLSNHLLRLKARRADIPNPEIPVRIDLALDRVTDIVKVISSIGQIVVDGRVYPSQSNSPAIATPKNSPSPNSIQNQVQPQPPPPPQQNSMYMSQQQQQRMINAYPNYPGASNQPQMVPQGMKQPQQHVQNPIQNLSQAVQNLNASKMGGGCLNPAMNALNRLSQQQQMSQHQQQMPPMQSQQQQHMQQQRMQQPPPSQHPQGPPPMRQANLAPQLHARMPVPPMNQQVSSSTHPHTNLRNLLQPNGNNAVYIQTGPMQYQAVQPQYVQHYQNRMPYKPQQGGSHNRQQGHPPYPGPSQQRFAHPGQRHPMPYNAPVRFNNTNPPNGKWHIPQSGAGMAIEQMPPAAKATPVTPTLNPNYKIMLKSQNFQSNVTSTNPKTPSPNNYLTNDNNPEKAIDKFCEDSVNDLMATIAKLDSNGVQVLAENRPKTTSPHADSSTGDVVGKMKNEVADKDDPNEDWCAVCLDGGELVCCDKCPKVFHQFCHIPALSVEESDTWQCLLCMNFADIPDNNEKVDDELTQRQRKLAERIVLELYCQYEHSMPFREVVSSENREYHEIIKHPIALDVIRQRLDWNARDHYKSFEDLVKDVRLMFKNARLFNDEYSQVFNSANALEKFFDEQLEKWLPEYAYEMFDDEDVQPPMKRYRRIITD